MTALDLGFLVALGFYVLMGAIRGLVSEVFSVLAWIVAVVGASWLGALMGRYLPLSGRLIEVRGPLGAALVFVVLFVAIRLAGHELRDAVVGPHTQDLDRLLGAIFGLARGAIMIVLAVFLLQWTPLIHTAMWRRSRLRPYAQTLAALVRHRYAGAG